METPPETGTLDEMRSDYDFRSMKGVVRGKYARGPLRMVRLASDVAAAFSDDDAVNAALRQYLREHPVPAGSA